MIRVLLAVLLLAACGYSLDTLRIVHHYTDSSIIYADSMNANFDTIRVRFNKQKDSLENRFQRRIWDPATKIKCKMVTISRGSVEDADTSIGVVGSKILGYQLSATISTTDGAFGYDYFVSPEDTATGKYAGTPDGGATGTYISLDYSAFMFGDGHVYFWWHGVTGTTAAYSIVNLAYNVFVWYLE